MLCYCSLTTGESSMSTHQWRPAAYAAPPFVHRTNSGSGALPSGEPAAGSEGGNRERRGHPPPPPACRPQRPIQSMMVLAKTAASGHRAARNKQTRTQRPPPGSPCVPCRAMPCHARRPVGLSLSLSKRSKWDAHGAGGGPRGGMNDGLAWPGRSKLSLGNPTTGS
jgi:hypothetical protein